MIFITLISFFQLKSPLTAVTIKHLNQGLLKATQLYNIRLTRTSRRGANLTSLAGVINLYVAKAFKRVTAPSSNYTEASSSTVLKEIVLNNFKRVVMLIKKRVEG